MDPSSVFWGLVAVQWVMFLWNSYLTYRQLRLHKKTEKRPAEINQIIDDEQYKKARLYSIDRITFKLFKSTFDITFSTVLLIGGYYPRLWAASTNLSPSYPIAVFLALSMGISLVVDLPLSLYENFVVEELHGFNKYTIGFYLVDTLKKSALSYVLSTPLSMAAVWVIDNGGDYFFVYLWVFVTVIILVMMTVYPAFIAPLFDTYIPLPDGDLKTAIENLAASLDYPLKKLYVVDGSKRSAHSNAYMYGFWKNKRIVLYDTLLSGEEKKKVSEAMGRDPATYKDDGKGMGVAEVVGVLGHELGHWAEYHTVWQLLMAEFNIFFALFCFSQVHKSPLLSAAFQFEHPMPSLISLLIVMQYVMGVYTEVFGYIQVYLTRVMEFSADAFAVRLGHSSALCTALIKLSHDNLSLPVNDSLYSSFTFTHPPVPERIAAIKSKAE